MNIQKIEKLIKRSTKINSFLGTSNSCSIFRKNCNNIILNRYYSNNNNNNSSKSNDIEQLISSDNLKNSNRNLHSIESIIQKYPNKDDFQNYLNRFKPIGKQLYDFMVLSRYSYDNDINNSQYNNIFNKYLEEEIIGKNLIQGGNNEVTLDFILEFNSRSYRKFDRLFSILFNNQNNNNYNTNTNTSNNGSGNDNNNINNNIKITANQFSLFFDSIIKVQNKIQNDNTILMNREQEKRIDGLIIEIVDLYLNLLKMYQVQLNIGHYNKILEIYYNCNGKNVDKTALIKETLNSIYLSHIKPDTETYMIAFPYISETDSKLLLSKIKGDSNYKSGPNTYQLLSSQFDKLIK
ncbi:hypothetical protein ACTA71_003958 [Dictyostelium dimigraforme]